MCDTSTKDRKDHFMKSEMFEQVAVPPTQADLSHTHHVSLT